MKSQKFGDILDVNRGIIVQQVNAQGVMNGGIAKSIRDRYPNVYDAYRNILGAPYTQKDSGKIWMGQCIIVYIHTGLYVANIVGQQFFGREKKRYTSYDALDEGMAKVAIAAKLYGLDVHYPLIGAGLGGGDWSIIQAIIDKNLGTINHTLWQLPVVKLEDDQS